MKASVIVITPVLWPKVFLLWRRKQENVRARINQSPPFLDESVQSLFKSKSEPNTVQGKGQRLFSQPLTVYVC